MDLLPNQLLQLNNRVSSISRNVTSKPYVPIRLAIKFGVSFAITTPLPKTSSPNVCHEFYNFWSCCILLELLLSNFKYRGGLKKCVPRKCFWKSSERPSAIASILIPDVFELIIVPGLRTASIFSYKLFFNI